MVDQFGGGRNEDEPAGRGPAAVWLAEELGPVTCEQDEKDERQRRGDDESD